MNDVFTFHFLDLVISTYIDYYREYGRLHGMVIEALKYSKRAN